MSCDMNTKLGIWMQMSMLDIVKSSIFHAVFECTS